MRSGSAFWATTSVTTYRFNRPRRCAEGRHRWSSFIGSFVKLNTPRPLCCLTKISTTAAAITFFSSARESRYRGVIADHRHCARGAERKDSVVQSKSLKWVAPRAGFEPATQRLTAACSTTELPGIRGSALDIGAPSAGGQACVASASGHVRRLYAPSQKRYSYCAARM